MKTEDKRSLNTLCIYKVQRNMTPNLLAFKIRVGKTSVIDTYPALHGKQRDAWLLADQKVFSPM